MSFATISVIGLLYRAANGSSVCLTAKTGNCVDINQHAVDTINRGEIHIVEPDLASVVKPP